MFNDADAADRIVARLSRSSPAFAQLMQHVAASPDPDKCLANLDRWLSATGDVVSRIDTVAGNPALCHRICFLCGASQAVADILVQNPELGMLLSDSHSLHELDTVESLRGDGERLIESAISFSHSLDRIRYLKQRQMVKLVWCDMSSVWEPRQVWQAISILADAVLQLAVDVVWRDLGGMGTPPVAVIAMGKHGTSELNYSSDIDLVFVSADDADLGFCTKFCERLTRALEGKMGRGSLYRIDLRLRPLGSAGPIVQSLSSTLTYYESYCEPWEVLAMLKARACAGDAKVGAEFIRRIQLDVFKASRSEMFLEAVVDAKRRYENTVRERGDDQSNIKLGSGGIRDIEFFVQVLQLLSGHVHPDLKGASTLDAVSILKDAGLISQRRAATLTESYALFRQVEHRIQLRYDLQSHSLPSTPVEQAVLARLVGAPNWNTLGADLRKKRGEVRNILEAEVPMLARAKESGNLELTNSFSLRPDAPEADVLTRLIDHADDPGGLASQLRNDKDARERVRLLINKAPRVANELCYHPELWDVAFSEEVEHVPKDEADVGEAILQRLSSDDVAGSLSASLRREFAASCLKQAFHGDVQRTFARLTTIAETSLVAMLDQVGGRHIDIVGLGRLGSKELSLSSDWDIMLLVSDDDMHTQAERIGEAWLRECRNVAMASGYFPIDVRLRPEGGKGLVVRSAAGFAKYIENGMETWERLAFTRARSIRACDATEAALRKTLEHKSWGWDEETEILAMRERILSERLHPWERKRDLKLGEGFLLDIEWLCSVIRLRHHELYAESRHTAEFLHRLGELGIIGAVESSELTRALLKYCKLRDALYLLDFESDSLMPENPEKLERLAAHVGSTSGNALLGEVDELRLHVTEVFGELVGRA